MSDPIVLLHSGGMSGRQWRKLRDRLAPERVAIAPDFIGSGERPLFEGTTFDHAEDVAEIERTIDALGSRVHLVGHSYGGMVALTVARRRPELVRSLAVYDPVAFHVVREAGEREAIADLARAEADPVFSDDALGGGDRWYRAFVEFWNGPGAWDALPEPARRSFLRVGRKVYLEVLSLMRDATPLASYAAITAPTLLMHGARSPLAARRVVALLATAIPRATVRAIDGAGHMGPITHAEAVESAIVEHVARGER